MSTRVYKEPVITELLEDDVSEGRGGRRKARGEGRQTGWVFSARPTRRGSRTDQVLFFAILKNTIVIINTKSNKNEEKMERQKVLVGAGRGEGGRLMLRRRSGQERAVVANTKSK